jgi:hypothetical protein
MAMHNMNSLLKFIAIPTLVITFLLLLIPTHKETTSQKIVKKITIKNIASNDSAAESLDTLTADLSKTKQEISIVSKGNESLRQENTALLNQIKTKNTEETSQLSTELSNIESQIENLSHSDATPNRNSTSIPIEVVNDITQPPQNHNVLNILNKNNAFIQTESEMAGKKIPDVIPYYTIPANGTSVHDKLMTALVGRIPIKGIVTDPYPFKIVISDDNLAANGLRIPHLLQMIVSGYCEGDLILKSVRGWITSLTFVFDDGTISSSTSNDNDIGNFTKSNSLGYLSDMHGNPFIRGRLITNAVEYLAGNIALGAAAGAANATAQSQTTNSSFLGSTTSAVTGSSGKYILGQAESSAATEVQQWWHDRQEQSFDAIYVPTIDEKGNYVEIAVNFSKEIHIDYDIKGRKLNYAHNSNDLNNQLD